MKQIAMGLVGVIIVVLFVCISLNINSRYVRAQDITNNLTEAVEGSARSVLLDETIEVTSNDELAEFFMEALVYQIEEKDSLAIHVVEADIEKGILAVDVTQTFSYSSGEEGNVHYQKTIILDEIIEEDMEQYDVVYYLSTEDKEHGKIYKKYSLEAGSYGRQPVIPQDPTEEKRRFAGWMAPDGSVLGEESNVVTETIYYIAIFE